MEHLAEVLPHQKKYDEKALGSANFFPFLFLFLFMPAKGKDKHVPILAFPPNSERNNCLIPYLFTTLLLLLTIRLCCIVYGGDLRFISSLSSPPPPFNGLFLSNIKHEQLAYLDLYSPFSFSFLFFSSLGFLAFCAQDVLSGCSFIPLYQSVLLPLYQLNPINQSYSRQLYLLNSSCVSPSLPAVLYLSRPLFRPLSPQISPFDSVRSTDSLPIRYLRCS